MHFCQHLSDVGEYILDVQAFGTIISFLDGLTQGSSRFCFRFSSVRHARFHGSFLVQRSSVYALR